MILNQPYVNLVQVEQNNYELRVAVLLDNNTKAKPDQDLINSGTVQDGIREVYFMVDSVTGSSDYEFSHKILNLKRDLSQDERIVYVKLVPTGAAPESGGPIGGGKGSYDP